jgi:outer membrane lipoprotein carrier protein
LCLSVLLLLTVPAFGADTADDPLAQLDEILGRVDMRYSHQGFSADFFQSSTLRALGMTDTANGRLTVKRPDKMLWVYEKPEPQTIVTDGIRLWIYRPMDNQVMLGTAPNFFKDGKGASFLTDIRNVRNQFHVTIVKAERPGTDRLQLIPRRTQHDIGRILVSIDRETSNIVEIVTFNSYDDETRIELRNIVFQNNLTDKMFQFAVPEDTEIVRIDP